MPTDINSTKGSALSNSYLSLDDAEIAFDNMYGAEDWMTLSEDDQIRLLLTATEQIDYITKSNLKAQTLQALNFPMIINNEEVGYNEARRCCAIQALYIYENNDSIKSAVEESIQNIKTQNFGKVQTTKSSSGVNFFKRYDPKVIKLLAPYLDGDAEIFMG